MLSRLLYIVILSLSLTNCSWFGSKDKSSEPAPLVKFSASMQPSLIWHKNIGSELSNQRQISPVFKQNKIFTVIPKGVVKAFNAENGNVLWEKQLELTNNANISSSIGTGDGLVFIGDNKGLVIALSNIDGEEQWRTQVSSEILATPVASSGIVTVRCADGKLYGLNSNNGEQIWSYISKVPLLSLRGNSSPIHLQDAVITGFDNGKLVAMQLKTGKRYWEIQLSAIKGRNDLERMTDIDANLQLVGDMLYVSSFQGNTVGINISQGKMIWKRNISTNNGLTATDDVIYLSDVNDSIWAFDRYTGATLWKQDSLLNRKLTAPTTINNVIVVGDFEGYLHFLDKNDGHIIARQKVGNKLVQQYIVTNEEKNTLFSLNSDGNLYAIH
jgi:outer membrane protein assembly factor BamB